MKKFYILIILVFALLGCNKTEKAEIILSASNIEISSGGETLEFIVSSNVDWTSSKTGDIDFTFSPINGKAGETKVTIIAQKNLSSNDRNSTINLSGSGASASLSILQPNLIFNISPNLLEMDKNAETKTVNIQSNVSWEIENTNFPDWINSISPLQGENNGIISVSVNNSTNRKDKSTYILNIKYGDTYSYLNIYQDPAENHPPTKPTGLIPNLSYSNVSVLPQFSWDASSDSDGDTIEYIVSLSKDGINWNNLSAGTKTSISVNNKIGALEANTTYQYKVIADDGYNNGRVESDIITFITGNKDGYSDGEYIVYQESSMPNPVYLVFTGDGYSSKNFIYGGKFDVDLDRGIEGLFSIEPYKSYREYFTVYKVAAYSEEDGITNTSKGVTKNTAFSCVMEGGNSTGINCNTTKVFEYVYKVDKVTSSNITNSSIGVIINENVYAGTCISWSDGRNISMIPVYDASTTNQTKFENVVCHEMGGHGFGKLADEYRYYNELIPNDKKSTLIAWQGRDYNLNVSVTSILTDVPWSNIINKEGYSHVGVFPGAYLYMQGVWRSEYVSCMEDNRMYYNAQSRWLIVKRIFEVAKEDLTWNKFVAKDVIKSEPSVMTKSVDPNFRPLGNPIMIME